MAKRTVYDFEAARVHYDAGKSLSDISKNLQPGRSAAALHQRFRKMGVTLRKRGGRRKKAVA